MIKHLTYIFLLAILLGCDVGSSRPVLPQCEDQCKDKDVAMFDLQNVDNEKIYFLYGYSDSGVFPYNQMQQGEIEPKSMHRTGIPFNNAKFNHFYFFSSPLRREEDLIGRFIIRNTQPSSTTLCKIRVRHNGDFTGADNRFLITNTTNSASYRYAQSPNWRYFDISSMNAYNFGGCGQTRLNTASSEYYHHLYFFSGESAENNENTLLSKIVYFNSNSEKINIFNIVIR